MSFSIERIFRIGPLFPTMGCLMVEAEIMLSYVLPIMISIIIIISCMSALQPWGGYGLGGRGGNWGMARPPIQGDTRLR